MAYTFGGAVGHLVSYSPGVSQNADNRSQLFTLWVYPTTLTSGRYILGVGAADSGILIHSVTDEIQVKFNRVTDSIIVTTDLDLQVDTWRFLAVLTSTETTGDLNDTHVWAGDAVTPPVKLNTSVNVAGSGAVTGGTTTAIGNMVGGSLSFQGDIDEFRWIATSLANSATRHPLFVSTSGVITNDEAQLVYDKYILDAWAGNSWYHALFNPGIANAIEYGWWSGRNNGGFNNYSPGTIQNSTTPGTYTGATWSQNRCPKPTIRSPFLPPFRAAI